MTIRVSYKEPNYYYTREQVGITTWRNVSYPRGYLDKIITADNENDLRDKIKYRIFYETHNHRGRPLTLNDLTIVEWT
jgi:hypothetical protein